MIALVNAPAEEALPSLVKLSESVGEPVVFQTKPWAVGFGKPRATIVPLPVAVEEATSVAACVVTEGATAIWRLGATAEETALTFPARSVCLAVIT